MNTAGAYLVCFACPYCDETVVEGRVENGTGFTSAPHTVAFRHRCHRFDGSITLALNREVDSDTYTLLHVCPELDSDKHSHPYIVWWSIDRGCFRVIKRHVEWSN